MSRELRERARRLEADLARKTGQYKHLLAIGLALATETDTDVLQDLMLRKAREMTQADAGSLYLVRERAAGERELLFLYAQNDSGAAPVARMSLPLTPSSLAGYVALTGQAVRLDDAYAMPPGLPFRHNRAFDERFGYRTGSVLTLPLFGRRGGVIGVLQVMNRKRRAGARLSSPAVAEREVVPFSDEEEQLLRSFAGLAGAALENTLLLESVEQLFDGFIRAATTAVESRDPTTCGHSLRVADLTVALAEAVNRTAGGEPGAAPFDGARLRELRYAAILHDFGKIGVREHVLVKSKKLYEHQLDRLAARFAQARRAVESRYSRLKLERLLAGPRETFAGVADELDRESAAELARLDHYWRLIERANEPTVLETECAAELAELAARFYEDADGSQRPFLGPDELRLLSVRRGSLDEAERREIESHVVHTAQFLAQIPWTRDLSEVAAIAAGHHERLDGSGYPNGLAGDEVPLAARVLAIADVYDALTAADRPYKPAVPGWKALEILRAEARAGKLDAELVELFIRDEVYRVTELAPGSESASGRPAADARGPAAERADDGCCGALVGRAAETRAALR